MRKKFFATLLTIIAVLLMVGCGENANGGASSTTSEIPDLTGAWKSEDNDGSYQEAIISDNVIEINWISDGGKTKSIYWIGTYTAPTEAVETYEWISERDKEKTDTAMFASSDDTKTFSYIDGKLSYEVSVAGTTTTLELTKE